MKGGWYQRPEARGQRPGTIIATRQGNRLEIAPKGKVLRTSVRLDLEKTAVPTYKDLIAWQRAMNLVVEILSAHEDAS